LPAPDEPPRRESLSLSGDYAYLSEGYYACQDAELAGAAATPSCADALDAYVVPIALEKAAKAGVPVPESVLTHEYFPVPAVCYGVNPFSRTYAFVRDEAAREREARRLTWNHKYAMCCQLVTPATTAVEFRAVCGRTEDARFADWADRLFGVFRIPLATIRLLETPRVLFSALEPLPWKSVTETERRWAREFLRG